VLIATGKGETMAAVQDEAYDRARNVLVPNRCFRDDIGDRWHRVPEGNAGGDGDRLQAWGYLERRRSIGFPSVLRTVGRQRMALARVGHRKNRTGQRGRGP